MINKDNRRVKQYIKELDSSIIYVQELRWMICEIDKRLAEAERSYKSTKSRVRVRIEYLHRAKVITSRDRDILIAKHVLNDNYNEIGKGLGISRERVRQIIAEIGEKLKLSTGEPLQDN